MVGNSSPGAAISTPHNGRGDADAICPITAPIVDRGILVSATHALRGYGASTRRDRATHREWKTLTFIVLAWKFQVNDRIACQAGTDSRSCQPQTIAGRGLPERQSQLRG